MKIAVYAISKNEEHFVERFCKSAADADYIVIADTGSTDNTAAVAAQQPKTTVHNICITPWRFDKARDAALALVPVDADVCISLDLDEVMEPGWRQEIERLWVAGVTRLRYKFDWSSGVVFYSEKIHSRKGYHWHHPCHEYIVPDKRTDEVWAHTDMLLISHHPDPTKSRGQYMDLLEVAVAEDPNCPRNAFYYARELTFNGRWAEAIAALHKYLAMPAATWAHERCYAMRTMGKSYAALGQRDAALKWYRLACAEAPNTREPWVDLAEFAYKVAHWKECYFASTTALDVTVRELVYTCDPKAWTEKPHDLAAIAAYNLGLYDIALAQGETASNMAPDDTRLHTNLQFYRASVT